MSDLIRREDAILAAMKSKSLGEVWDRLENIEPVDAVEVSPAYWTYDGIEFKCSACGEWQEVRSNYCPECGAKMDGGENDE